ncbi:efflux RND transporter permease subunit [Paenibacillus glufosinatiresistens]|uniref:efflux RND transporter permease subunit n=1 Tax=Paenibacillus glufosinatiresistens TaxID=3070657 RepID=UPI00286D734D|nr:efflux RND transporter permease subunit [Paenibacillus sp. YX.27]
MERLTRWTFRNRAAAGLLIVIALIAGVMSYFKLPMEFMPEADNPQVTVTVLGPGQDTAAMEERVTGPIESAVSAVKGKTGILSTTGDGYSQINLNFDGKTDMKAASQDVQKAVDALTFPEGVMKPFVVQLNTSMIPVSQLTMAFDEGLTEQALQKVEKEILPALEDIDGVANVALYGRSAPVVNVRMDPAKMAASGVSLPQIMGVLQGRSVSASIGEQTIAGETGSVNVTARIDSVETLKRLPVADGVTLGSVAAVEVRHDQESVSRSNGRDVLVASVTKEAGANAADVGSKVADKAKELSKSVKGAHVEVIFSTSDMVVDSVNSMMREVLLGALFATIVILIFLRNVRATLITAVSIPLSLAVTLYLLDLSGITLNIITLGGVAVAVGRLVDDSIVVIENIYRRLQREAFSVDMIVSATKEVAAAITSSTIATVAVFLPMGLLRGSLQAFLLPFALTVTYSLLTSLVVALTVVPLLGSGLLRKGGLREHKPSRSFLRFLNWNLSHKWVSLTLGTVVLIGSIAAYVTMPKAALDASDASYVSVQLKYPNDKPVAEVLERGKQLEAELIKQPQTGDVVMQSGNSADMAKWGSVSSTALVDYTIVIKKGTNAQALIDHIESLAGDYKGAVLSVSEMSLMGSSGATEYIDIVGDDLETLKPVAAEVQKAIQPVEGIRKITSNMDDTKPVFAFKIDPAVSGGQEISQQLAAVLNPIPLGEIDLNGAPSKVMLAPSSAPKTESDLRNLTILTAQGPKKIGEIAELETTRQPAMLYHKDGKPYIRITADVDPKRVSEIGKDIAAKTKDIKTPDGVKLYAGGASAEQSGDFADLGMTALLSIGLVYLIMVLTFRTLRAPLAIMFSLPLAAIGAVIALLISGTTPDFTALFGALMLIGIVVTNAIVLIDRVKHNEDSMSIRESLLEAAGTRMRPILMTAVATICAMVPLLFGHSEQGSIVSQSLAIVVVGGLTAATVLTLVVVPVIYELLHFRKAARQRRQNVQKAA